MLCPGSSSAALVNYIITAYMYFHNENFCSVLQIHSYLKFRKLWQAALHMMECKENLGGIHMSDVAATNCGCGCECQSGGNSCCNLIFLILILCCCCGGGNNNGCFEHNCGCGCGCGGFGGDFCWIIILLLFCGGGNNSFC